MTNLTANQRYNLQEWLGRMEEGGSCRSEAVVIFNERSALEQKKIISQRWYNTRTGKPIRRRLLSATD